MSSMVDSIDTLAIFRSFSEVVFSLAFLLVFSISSILLRPFRIHQKRKISTIAMKVSYLVYLFFLLIYAFFLLFYKVESLNDELVGRSSFDQMVLISSLFVFIFPHITIMIRRKIRKQRINYNWVCTLINCFFILYIIIMMKITDWQF